MRRWTPDGKCTCGYRYDDRETVVTLRAPPSAVPVQLARIPQGECAACGSRVYSSAVLQLLEIANRQPAAGPSGRVRS